MERFKSVMQFIGNEIVYEARREFERGVQINDENNMDEYLADLVTTSKYLQSVIFNRIIELIDFEELAKEL